MIPRLLGAYRPMESVDEDTPYKSGFLHTPTPSRVIFDLLLAADLIF